MFLEFYRLDEQPFGVTPSFKHVFPSPSHREAMASLVYAVQSDLGFSALIAEPGMGKTTLIFKLMTHLRDSALFAFLFQTQCTSREFLRALLDDLGLEPSDDLVVMHDRLKQLLVREAGQRRVVVIVDEAQNLAPEVLETVRLLSDFETSERKLLHIVLSGQPQLADKLASRELVQLQQRVQIIARLTPLKPPETVHYIEYRLRAAGYQGEPLFTPDAYRLIAEASEGIPRNINRLCFNALSLGCATGTRQIDESIVKSVIADLDFQSLRRDYYDPQKNASELQAVFAAAAGSAPDPDELGAERWFEKAFEARSNPASLSDLQEVRTGTDGSALFGITTEVPQAASAGPQLVQSLPAATIPPASFAHVPQPIAARPRAIMEPRPVNDYSPSAAVAVSARSTPAESPKPEWRPEPSPRPPRERSTWPQPRRGRPMAVISTIVAVPLLISVWLLVRAQNVQPVTNPAPSGAATVDMSENAQPVVIPEDRSQTQSTRLDVLPRRPPIPAAAPGTYAATKERSVAEASPDVPEPLSIRKPEPRPLTTAPVSDPPAPPQPAVAPDKPSSGLLATLAAAIPHRVDPPAPPPVPRYEPPRLLRRTPPAYPYIARQTGIQGEVVLIADIGQDGRVTAVRTIKGNPQLARAAADAVRNWKYDPATQDGKPVGSATEVRVRFTLHDN